MVSLSRFRLALAPALLAATSWSAPLEKPPLQHAMMGVANGCFVETVAFLDRWREVKGADAWARLLQWGAREDEEVVTGHAVAICEAADVLWSWDTNFGWTKLPVSNGERDHASVVAAPVLRRYAKTTARFPLYRFDFAQRPAASLPSPQLANLNTSVRDASIVAAQLGKSRPVNAVAFSYGPADAKRESAAAIFVFHGRFCIYVPEAGTVPFRAHGDVANIRLIQDLLRRGFPGVTGVRKL